MKFHAFALAVLASVATLGTLRAESPAPQSAEKSSAPKEAAPVYNFTVKSIDGKDVNLSQYKGKVLLIVNVASKCGNTKQYTPLEAMHKKYKDQGLAILGFPANNFGHQEPGTDAEIATFCSSTYHVDFDMFSKISVKGDDKAPLYQYLTSKETNPKFGGEVTWNFEKFLIGRDGQIVARFAPKTQPDSPEVVKAIEAELAKK